MQTRDSSNKTTHFGSDLMVGVREANNNAPYLTGSTGAAAVTYGVKSDSTAANIAITALGTGGNITLTASSNIVLASSGLYLGSTVAVSSRFTAMPIRGIFTSTHNCTIAALSSHGSDELTFASTICDVWPGDLVTFSVDFFTGVSTSFLAVAYHRLSTVDTSRLTLVVKNVTSSASGTNSGEVRFTWIDLT